MSGAAARGGPAPGRVVVVGGGLGGLSCALHLRLAGARVTLLEARERVGGRANLIETGGYRFDTGPSLLNYPWVFEALFAAAGRKLADKVPLIRVDPSVRFLWPDGTAFTLSSDFGRLREECERLEPGSAAGLASFLADAERKYRLSFDKLVTTNEDNPLLWFGRLRPSEMLATAVWRSLYDELGRFFHNRRIREALSSYAMYLGGSPWQLPGLFSILPYGELAYGLWLPRGGIYALIAAVERMAREAGVEIRTGCPARRIEVREGTVHGVRLPGGDLEEAPVVVSNVDVPTTVRDLLPPAIGAGRRTPRMTPGVVTFYIGLRRAPAGLPHHTIFLPSDARSAFGQLCTEGRIPDELPFYVSVASATDPALAPAGGAGVFVLVPVPVLSRLAETDWPRCAADLRDRVLRRLAAHGCAWDPADVAVEQVWTPVDWRDAFGLFDGSAFGASHRLFELGPFRSRNYDRNVRGLYYTGASTTPGTGLPLVVLGGEMTARRVLAHARQGLR